MKPIISSNIRIRVPEAFEIGRGSVIDDFCYFSTKFRMGEFSHIASGCSIAGGPERLFSMGKYSSVSSGAKIWCASNDFVNDLVMLGIPGLNPPMMKIIEGDVCLEDYTGIGSNSVVMPGCLIPEGTVIGAQSFVPAFSRLEPWSVYAGSPVRRIKERNRRRIESQIRYLEEGLIARAKGK